MSIKGNLKTCDLTALFQNQQCGCNFKK